MHHEPHREFAQIDEGTIGGMAGHMISGNAGEPDPVEDPTEWRPEGHTVFVQTEHFKAEAIPLFLMPANAVLEAMIAPEQQKLTKMFDLFKLSVYDPAALDVLEVISFQEFNQMIATWLSLSNQLEEKLYHQREDE